jgi:galactoside O-acetyltransferase
VLGLTCVIIPGVTIAEGSVIGAGSLVTKSTEPWMVYVGTPARSVKRIEKDNIKYGQEIEENDRNE